MRSRQAVIPSEASSNGMLAIDVGPYRRLDLLNRTGGVRWVQEDVELGIQRVAVNDIPFAGVDCLMRSWISE